MATYTVNGGPSQFQGGVSNDNGEFSFSTGNLLAAANGMIIKITKIVNDGSLCETSFNNKQVTLQLATVNTKDIAPVGKFGSENNANVEFVLYPNPVNDILNIQSALDIKSVEILNINGQKVLSSKQKQINVSHLPAGMYMVRIQDVDNNTATKKIIIK